MAIIITNNNGESIFKERPGYTIGDSFTASRWGNYIPRRINPHPLKLPQYLIPGTGKMMIYT